jgi:hypothetical protein
VHAAGDAKAVWPSSRVPARLQGGAIAAPTKSILSKGFDFPMGCERKTVDA